MIYKNVSVGEKTIINDAVILGIPPNGKKEGELRLSIGKNGILREFTVIYAGSLIGDNFHTGHYVLIRENNKIGDNVSVGTTTKLELGNKIGNNVRIHSGCFLENVEVEDNVFIGPNVIFTDDPHPPCPKYEECVSGAVVKKNVSIGANSTILPGIVIGKNSLIGAGSVVVKEVPENSVVAGNPARVIKNIKELKCIKNYFKKPYEWRE